MRPSAGFVVASALLAVACSSSDVPPPAAAAGAPACRAALATEAGADLVLVGTGACPDRVRLALRVATGDPDAPTWSDAAAAPIEVGGGWSLGAAGAERTLVVRNRGASTVQLVGLEWSGPLPRGADRGGGRRAVLDRMLHGGYQSWSYTGIESLPDEVGEALGTAAHGGDNEDVLGEKPGVSWWFSALASEDGVGLVVGAVGGTVLKTYVAADTTALRVVMGVTGDALELAPGAARTLDGLFVGLGDAGEQLDVYARRVASLHPPPRARRPALGGWGSWNLYYAEPTAQGIRDEMQWAHTELAPLGLGDFLLDDGYEPHWGAWTAKPDFGAELAELADEQTALGLTPAIWIAPFYVDVVDPVVGEHADWFVHAADGSLRTYSNLTGPTYAALDGTHPGARAFVVDQLQALWAAGYRTFKLDFLFGGAVEGRRREAVTGLESFALWMRTLREALPDAHLVGCGAPQLPSVGWVDSMRTGPDIAFTVSPTPRYGLVAAQARHTALRAPTDAWWAVDPDVVLLRSDTIDDVEAWTAAVSSALAGGNYLLGDGRQAGALRAAMALDPALLELHDGRAARAVDLMRQVDPSLFTTPLFDGTGRTNVPHVWRKASSSGAHEVVAVFGWNSEEYSTSLELPAGAVEIVPPSAPGSPSTVEPRSGTVEVAVAPHAVRLFRYALP